MQEEEKGKRNGKKRGGRGGGGCRTKWQLIKFWSPLDYSNQNGFDCNQIVVTKWFWVPLNYGN
jgi:hypothetical protein